MSLRFSDEVARLKLVGLLGRGGYGLVKLVKDPISSRCYALKEVRKDKVIEKHQEVHINDERRLMMRMNSAFLVKLWRTYQDDHKVYFLLETCLGGDLFTLLRRTKTFKEDVAKFYAGCVLLGFQHLHSMNMVYRDLKPENLVLDSRGYIKITDFGFCKKLNENGQTFTLCGTPDYLAPEVIRGKGHGLPVDFWTLGILIYEMLCAMPPFYDREPSNIYRKVVKSEPSFPAYVSKEAKDLMRGLLRKKPSERLGAATAGSKTAGFNAIKKHPWFVGFDWRKLKYQTMEPPYSPKVKDEQDASNFKCRKIKEKPFKKIKSQKPFRSF